MGDNLMARTSARNVNPCMSSDARDKLLAALNWQAGKWERGADYDRAPMYFDACPGVARAAIGG
jgi:hypothetical protein